MIIGAIKNAGLISGFFESIKLILIYQSNTPLKLFDDYQLKLKLVPFLTVFQAYQTNADPDSPLDYQ